MAATSPPGSLLSIEFRASQGGDEPVPIARGTFLSKAWKESEAAYTDIFRRFDKDVRRELAERFDR